MRHGFTYSSIVCALAMCGVAGCVVAPVQLAEIKAPRAIPSGADASPIEFRRIVTKLPLGEEIGQFQYGWGCFPGATITWRGGRLNITDEELTETFRKELESNNYPVVGDPYALFGDPSAWKAEVLVAGVVDKVDVRVCYPFSGSPNVNIGNTSTLKGGAFMRVAWQIYSRTARKVVYATTTEGAYKTEETISGGLPIVLRNAFAANVRNLLADPGFHSLVLKNTIPEPELRPKMRPDSTHLTPNPRLHTDAQPAALRLLVSRR
jgi:serine protease Do